MSKIKIEDLPSLEDIDPEDQRSITGGKALALKEPRRNPSPPVMDRIWDDEDIIVSRIPDDS